MFILIVVPGSAYSQLVANFSSDTTKGCAPLFVRFSDRSTGNPVTWYWDLGNGITSTQQNPTTFYFNPGTYNVKLVVRNATGVDSIVRQQYITVFHNPVANFTVSDSAGCLPLTVRFFDASTSANGNITNWEWDFGDGTISNQQNPVHTYNITGSFTITLRVRDSNGCMRTLSKPMHINVLPILQADFTTQGTPACNAPATVQFTNTSLGAAIVSQFWDFGDGNTSTAANPTHTYSSAGNYTVKLIVRNATGCVDTLVRPNAVAINRVRANFSFPDTICQGAPTSFVNTSTPTSGSSYWTFGDNTSSTDANPIKVFSAAGTYVVKLVKTVDQCVDSISKTIVVKPKPTAAFTVSQPPPGCSLPVNVSFSASTSGIASYQWSFGDGASSTIPNPTHSYTTHGSHTVTLVVKGVNGCTDSLVKRDEVVILQPIINRIDGLPFEGCAPFSKTLSADITSPEPITSYLWNFGDSTTSIIDSPTHTWNIAGNYTVTLTVTTASGCSTTYTLPNAVVVGDKPVANFTATPLNACANDPIQFTNLSSSNVTAWNWSFGDGQSSTDQNPLHHYTDTGHLTVTLIVSNRHCYDTMRVDQMIYIKPPIAEFAIEFSCDTPMVRRFINKSLGATSFSWNFGDGNTSTQENPTHTYAVPGNYVVRLFVTNGGCKDDFDDSVYVVNAQTNFTATSTPSCKLTPVVFAATNPSPGFLSYTWNFGDGYQVTTDSSTVTHNYSTPGNYNPTLKVLDRAGCEKTMTQSLAVDILGPKVAFDNDAGNCINMPVNFTSRSVPHANYPIISYIWNYGDGIRDTTTSTTTTHSYATAANYAVTLIAIDSYGCRDSVTQYHAVNITHPIANFTIPDSIRCKNNQVRFVNQSQGQGLSYSWTFGDGNTSVQQNPINNYVNEGLYDISLSIRDINGCTSSITKQSAVRIANPIATFTMSDTVANCPPFVVQLNNISSAGSSIVWDFDDGSFSSLDSPSHYYNAPGVYRIKLTVNGYGNCVDTAVKVLRVKGPTGYISYSPFATCAPGEATFRSHSNNSISYVWDFGDGNTLATSDSVVKFTYTDAGTYYPRLLMVDTAGCSVPVTGLDAIRVAGVEAKFNQIENVYCDSAIIQFSDSSKATLDVIESYRWNFGDNAVSTQQNPLHTYHTEGIYPVTLIVRTASGCTDTMRQTIKVINSPLISVSGDSSICIYQTATFAGNVLRTDTSALSWSWTFGNGNTYNEQNPASQNYPSAGTYQVVAISRNPSGCADTATQVLQVHARPAVNAGDDAIICLGDSIMLQATGATTYVWNQNSTINCNTCANPVVKPTDTLNNYVVTGTSAAGCNNADSVMVRVVQPLTITAFTGDTLCNGEQVNLWSSGADHYRWIPATGLSNANISNPVARPSVTTHYMVIGTDFKGCFEDTAMVPVVVYPIPQFNIIQDYINSPPATPVTIQTTSSADITRYKWLPSHTLSCNDCSQPVASPTITTTYRGYVSNDGGCIAEDNVTINVICSNANLFVPNTFSPNNDGMNDHFYPRGKGISGVKFLRIFNRWGAVVYERQNFSINDPYAGWDGTFKGQPAMADVYVYDMEVICDNNQILPVKGNLTLIK